MSIAAFLVLVGGPWVYLLLTEQRPAASNHAGSQGILLDDEWFAGTSGKRSWRAPADRAPGDPNVDTPTTAAPKPVEESPASGKLPLDVQCETISDFADRLDSASVRLRGDLAKGTLAQFALGAAALEDGRPEQALHHLENAVARDPRNLAALTARASALIELGRFEDASTAYEAIIELDPSDAEARYNHGVVLYRLSHFLRAAERLREALRLNPEHSLAWYNLASLAQRDGRLAEARAAWESFTRLRPDVASGWFNLGVVCMDYDLPFEAAASFDASVSIEPDDAIALLNLGIAYATAGEYELALDAVERARGIAPCDETILMHLAALHDILADRGGAEASDHRRMAGLLAEQVEMADSSP